MLLLHLGCVVLCIPGTGLRWWLRRGLKGLGYVDAPARSICLSILTTCVLETEILD